MPRSMTTHRSALRPVLIGLAVMPLLSGCAAMLRDPAATATAFPALAEPIGGLMARSAPVNPGDDALRAGLQAKAAALLAQRAPATMPGKPAATDTAETTAGAGAAAPAPSAKLPEPARLASTAKPAQIQPSQVLPSQKQPAQTLPPPALPTAAVTPSGPAAGRNDAVAAMLARARQANAESQKPANPAPAPSLAASAIPAGASPVEPTRPAKVQARLSDPATNRPGSVATIRFRAGDDTLDGEGNRQLADLARKTGLETGVRLIVIAGLAGNAPPWERLQLAGRRLETVARHVPPPLTLERRVDPALDGDTLQVTIAGGGQ